MKTLPQHIRSATVIVALFLTVNAPLLRAADPIPFPPPAAPDPDHIAPTLVHRVEPAYPSGLDKPTERRVFVAFVVTGEGTVRHATALFGADAPFAEAAVAAVNQWKFEPGRVSATKHPVSTQMTVELWFKPPPANAP